MKFIANILTNKPFAGGELYNVVSEKDGLISGIPTLVIGWDLVKVLYPSVNIINWQIDDDVYWTFGNREKRSVYEERCKKFNSIAIDKLIHSVEYKYFNILTTDNGQKEDFFEMLYNEGGVKIYLYNNMAYVYIPSKLTVYGLFLNDISYIGKSVNKFLSDLHKKENIEFVDISETITQETKYELRNCNYIIPYLMS